MIHLREDVSKPFRFLKYWELLQDLPKFCAVTNGGGNSCTGTLQSAQERTENITPDEKEGNAGKSENADGKMIEEKKYSAGRSPQS